MPHIPYRPRPLHSTAQPQAPKPLIQAPRDKPKRERKDREYKLLPMVSLQDCLMEPEEVADLMLGRRA